MARWSLAKSRLRRIYAERKSLTLISANSPWIQARTSLSLSRYGGWIYIPFCLNGVVSPNIKLIRQPRRPAERLHDALSPPLARDI